MLKTKPWSLGLILIAALLPSAALADSAVPESSLCLIPSNAPRNLLGPVVTIETVNGSLVGAIGFAFYWHGPVMKPHKSDPGLYGVLGKTEITKAAQGANTIYSGEGFEVTLSNQGLFHQGQISIDMGGWTLKQDIKEVHPLTDCAFRE